MFAKLLKCTKHRLWNGWEPKCERRAFVRIPARNGRSKMNKKIELSESAEKIRAFSFTKIWCTNSPIHPNSFLVASNGAQLPQVQRSHETLLHKRQSCLSVQLHARSRYGRKGADCKVSIKLTAITNGHIIINFLFLSVFFLGIPGQMWLITMRELATAWCS